MNYCGYAWTVEGSGSDTFVLHFNARACMSENPDPLQVFVTEFGDHLCDVFLRLCMKVNRIFPDLDFYIRFRGRSETTRCKRG